MVHARSIPATESPVSGALLDRVLRPYRPSCRYLHEAWLTLAPGEAGAPLPAVRGRFAIPGSFYIDDTGHFNAVELVLCGNQLGYVLIASAIEAQRIPALSWLTLDRFYQLQLGDILILDVKASFRRILDPRAFTGEVTWETRSIRPRLCLARLGLRFHDDADGACAGELLIAIRAPEIGA